MKITGFCSPWAALAVAVLLCGCATSLSTGGPTAEQRRAIESQKAAIVLLRITAAMNGKVMSLTGSTDEPWHCLRVQAVELGATATEAPLVTENRVPTSELGKVGWRYLVLPPGSYRLLIGSPLTPCGGLGPGGYNVYVRSWWRTRDGSNRPPGFWLNVPRGQSFLYAGSLHITCSNDWEASAATACSGDLDVADGTDAAGEIAGAHFSEYGPLTTSLIAHYGDPIDPARLRETQPLALVAKGAEELVSPDWGQYSKKFFAPSAWIIQGGSFPGIGGGGLGGAAVALGAAIIAVAYLPVGAALATADTALAERKWTPCLQGLVEEIREFDPIADLRQRLNENLREQGFDQVSEPESGVNAVSPAVDAGAKGVLQADIQRIQLRDCGAGGGKTFCLEVAVRASLIDVDTGEPLYDAAVVYSDENLRVLHSVSDFPFREFAVGAAESRELTTYCDADGRELFRTDLARALDVLAGSIVTKVAWEGRASAGMTEDTRGTLEKLDRVYQATTQWPDGGITGDYPPIQLGSLKGAITKYYNEMGVYKLVNEGPSGRNSLKVEMATIDEIEVVGASQDIIKVEIKFLWADPDSGYGRSERAAVTVERSGAKYEVLVFQSLH
ncbi:MAG: hypothetical protein ACE5H8_07490 [Alphaproteobacteria bacterium]